MKHQAKTMAIISAVYAALVTVFLMRGYLVTSGIGWEFFDTIAIAILSLPIYISVISVLRIIGNSKRLKDEPKTLDNRLEKALNIVSLCLVISSILLLVAFTVPLFTQSRNDLIRDFCLDVAPRGLLFVCIGNVAVLLNRPITRLLVCLIRHRNKSITIESQGIFITRICLLILEIAVALLALAMIFEFWR